ncbi:general transcription factor 3C polypeptide 5 [Teleopsis dalmanni]|uniref:general transcription factor 3C polypeptide 5 n=1 Tax=Teleopsis dalmanni TaxID=139649 RepID=UPI0018CD6382|nr:general transcription factor 3C polypeptide 5 [Teleopsis dalmanni]
MSVQKNLRSPKEIEVIEYPGNVVNVDKMLATLGGINKISQALSSQNTALQLKFHPENPFNKPVLCEPVEHTGFLLSVKVRRSKRDKTKPPKYEVTILGNTVRSFIFENLCDFQYLPLVKDDKQTLTFHKGLVISKSVTDVKYLDNSSLPGLNIPNVFARSDVVQMNYFRNEPVGDGQMDALGVLQKTISDSRDVINFSMVNPFPIQPDTQILKRMRVKYVSDEQFIRVKNLFEECPIWTRIALIYESGVLNDKLKCITPSLAYYFASGPWRTLFVRYGYDPRKDFNSRFYQTFDFRMRFRSGVSEFFSQLSDKRKNKRTTKDLTEMEYDDEQDDVTSLAIDANYPYLDEDRMPRSKQCILRYRDIHIPRIQEMLVKIPSPQTGAICNEKTGWLPQGFDNQVRHIISNNIRDILRNYYRTHKEDEEIKAKMVAENIENEDDMQLGVDIEEAEYMDINVEESLEDNFQQLMDDLEG